ncbi:MAG: cation transporter [Flavobacteriales bacterium]|nr:MAG: cation transporter [Flavobacteriales bacterium]
MFPSTYICSPFQLFLSHEHHIANEKKARFVVYLSAVVMVGEIGLGISTNSKALLADGWHMAAHVMAIGLTWFAYSFARKHESNPKFKHGTGKIFAIAGYTSAIILTIVAFLLIAESLQPLIGSHHHEIDFVTALKMACLGLVVNGISAFVLHHKEEHRDHNIHAAYLHVLADLVTSLAAIVALTIGYFTGVEWLDAVSGILSAIVIGNWSIRLAARSGRDILDYQTDDAHQGHHH